MKKVPDFGAADYIVECYRPGLTEEHVEQAVAELRRSASELEPSNGSPRCLGAIFVPADEAVFHLFDAASAQAVRLACERAQLDFERIVGTVPVGMQSDEGEGGAHAVARSGSAASDR